MPDYAFTETRMQAVIINWLLNALHHDVAIPNSTIFFPWEADVASVTRSLLSHEIEIKISRADFLKDKKKKWKHHALSSKPCSDHRAPNYFWYATPAAIAIDVPEYAGWITVTEHSGRFSVEIKKSAPRLHKGKIAPIKIQTAARLLSFRVGSFLIRDLNRSVPEMKP